MGRNDRAPQARRRATKKRPFGEKSSEHPVRAPKPVRRASRVGPIAAWERIAGREQLHAKDLPLALSAFHARYGDKWLVDVLQAVWIAEDYYAEAQQADGWASPGLRPELGAKACAGDLVFSSPSFWKDWLHASLDAEARDVLKRSSRRFMAALLGQSSTFRRRPRRADPERHRVFHESQRIEAELRAKIDAAIAAGDDPRACVTESIAELELEPTEAARVHKRNLATLARYVAIARSTRVPRDRRNLDWYREAEDSLRHFR